MAEVCPSNSQCCTCNASCLPALEYVFSAKPWYGLRGEGQNKLECGAGKWGGVGLSLLSWQ